MPASAEPAVLVLASASAARRDTLRAAGLDPQIQVSGVDERTVTLAAGPLEPVDLVLVLARAKAEDVAARLDRPDRRGALILGCDSVLELDGQTHGKPADAAEAVHRWHRMRGRSGVLHTGHWLIDARDPAKGAASRGTGATASTTVHFADVTDEEIERYVATGEPLQVAGAFTLDGLGGAFVRGIAGDHHAVVGVSLPLLRDLLAGVGVSWPSLWRPVAGRRPAPRGC